MGTGIRGHISAGYGEGVNERLLDRSSHFDRWSSFECSVALNSGGERMYETRKGVGCGCFPLSRMKIPRVWSLRDGDWGFDFTS